MKLQVLLVAAFGVLSALGGVSPAVAQNKTIFAYPSGLQDISVPPTERAAYAALTAAEGQRIYFAVVARRPISPSKMRHYVRAFKATVAPNSLQMIGDYAIDQARTAKNSAVIPAVWGATRETIRSRRSTPLYVSDRAGARVTTVPATNGIYNEMKAKALYGELRLDVDSGAVFFHVSEQEVPLLFNPARSLGVMDIEWFANSGDTLGIRLKAAGVQFLLKSSAVVEAFILDYGDSRPAEYFPWGEGFNGPDGYPIPGQGMNQQDFYQYMMQAATLRMTMMKLLTWNLMGWNAIRSMPSY